MPWWHIPHLFLFGKTMTSVMLWRTVYCVCFMTTPKMWSNLVGYAPQKNSSSDVGWRIKWYQKHSTMTCSNGESECQREEVTLWRDPQSCTRSSWIRECTTQHGPWCSWVQEDLRPRTSVKVLKKGLTSFPSSNIRKVNLNLELEKFTLCKKYMYTSPLPNLKSEEGNTFSTMFWTKIKFKIKNTDKDKDKDKEQR